jgi:hypothetical protein
LVVKTIGATMLLALSIACGRDKAAPKDSVAAQAPVAAATPGGAPMCQRTGHWSECTVRIRLDQSGLAPQSGADKVGDTTLIEDDNVLLLLFSKNEHQRERVADAITAGPPQP